MTEREKMLAGELYDCGDPELLTNKKGSIWVEPSKHRANQIFHKFTLLTWLQQILILGDSSQCTQQPPHGASLYPFFIHTRKKRLPFSR